MSGKGYTDRLHRRIFLLCKLGIFSDFGRVSFQLMFLVCLKVWLIGFVVWYPVKVGKPLVMSKVATRSWRGGYLARV